ncbi:TadA family conjugal transfer-associated ATPase [Epidermidibacterium keratini]|uniref:TadA family conjugal transfer-associated ATPase n=1 Tax=Epidermidibacterium keratini TaxID=1891644 RepID=A0A7L4YT23_9ACTN|nr:TadA family conjugal transfer-associated ATPase [Epidermidibacterium keratini]QHC02326.1 TadA family conjugal transfer-associated ATPase [Epidermidibacterium keratini]
MNPRFAGTIEEVRRELAADPERATPEQIADLVRSHTHGLISDRDLYDVLSATHAEVGGAGPLEPLLGDPQVTDVLVNGPRSVWVDRGAGLERTSVDLGDDDAVRTLAQRLAARAGRRLDGANPWVDVTLPDGGRLHAVISPISSAGALISVRTMRRRQLGLDALVAGGLPAEVVDLLVEIVRSRLSFLVCGGTGSGKTTLLSMLLEYADPAERVLVVEDADELRPDHPHTVKLLSRPPNIEGSGEITLRTLVRQSLRMRPDRVVVGEVRGPEIVELLMALNTGHRGGAGTIHANGVHDVPARIVALASLADLSPAAVTVQMSAALDVLVHVDRGPDGVRRVAEIAVIAEEHGRPLVRTVWDLRDGFTADAALLDARLTGGIGS